MFDPSEATGSEANGKAAVLSVSSLNRLARSLLEANFSAVLVAGEVSNLAIPASGHWYFTLKDKKSQIRCAMFAGRNRRLRFRPDDGTQVIARGNLSIYEARGDYQLIVDSLEEAGDGALRRAFDELKARLQAEGLFDAEHKQPVAANYRHIGLITSPTGAAVRDLITVFQRRFPATRLTVIPVPVQGREAAQAITQAIALANRLAKHLGLQALIVGRGGGSLEDLQAFNDEQVVRAIYASVLPVTSAVGHEIDFTIADFVADQRAPTPSAAAELMSPSQEEYLDQFAGYAQLLAQQMRSITRQGNQVVANLLRHLQRPDQRLQQHGQTLDRLEIQLKRTARRRIGLSRDKLAYLHRGLLAQAPSRALDRLRERMLSLRRRLLHGSARMLAAKGKRLSGIDRSLHAVSPLKTLARGYSITFNESGQVVRRADEVNPHQTLTTRLAKGHLKVSVEAVEPDAESAALTRLTTPGTADKSED